ncbi:AMP-binding protein [Saccharothrix syringae]|uniref:AMP-binding protein n=1 Tax=Saccharothrix syringae TaxID=103733 RepID=UPI001476E585|nr:AMP-binding protein [Saccharothrix syringae]
MSHNYTHRVLAALGGRPERVACHRPDGTAIRRGELLALIHRFAHVLAARGVRRGSSVTLLSENRVETMAARYAANLLGARTAFLYNGLAAAAQASVVADVGTDVLVVDAALAGRAAEVLERAPVATVLGLGPTRAWEDVLSLADEAPGGPVTPTEVDADDVCFIRYTGGTTGSPKGIEVAYGTQASLFDLMSTVVDADMVVLLCTTLAHAGGAFSEVVLGLGGRLVLHRGFDPAKVLADVAAHRVTELLLAPPLLYEIIDHPTFGDHDLSSLRAVNYGSCAASPTRIAQAVELLGPVLVQVYSQNEAGVISELSAREHLEPELLATVGRPVPGARVTIRDQDGDELPTGRAGEICVRSPTAAKGYWRNPELTARVWRDGEVRTGDVGYLDERGYLHLCDRIKDMVIVLGWHVYPAALEDLLVRHPAIARAAVFGVADADAVERVHAAVVTRPGHSVTPEQVRAFVTAEQGAIYAPHRVHLVRRLPLTDAGKPDKELLRRSLADR